METFPALLALCEGSPPVTSGFSSQRPVTRRFDVLFDVCLNKRLKNNRDTGGLRRRGARYDVTGIMYASNHLFAVSYFAINQL